jgi:hypothetical protein
MRTQRNINHLDKFLNRSDTLDEAIVALLDPTTYQTVDASERISAIIRSSNGLLTMTGMMLAILSGNPNLAKRMSGIQSAFIDCLPELLPVAAR